MKLKIINKDGFLSEKENTDIVDNNLEIGDEVEGSMLANNAYIVSKPKTEHSCILYTWNVEVLN